MTLVEGRNGGERDREEWGRERLGMNSGEGRMSGNVVDTRRAAGPGRRQ